MLFNLKMLQINLFKIFILLNKFRKMHNKIKIKTVKFLIDYNLYKFYKMISVSVYIFVENI